MQREHWDRETEAESEARRLKWMETDPKVHEFNLITLVGGVLVLLLLGAAIGVQLYSWR